MSWFQKLIAGLIIVCICTTMNSNSVAEELPRPLPGSGPQQGNVGKRFITIDFDNVDIHLFIKYISELSGKNFVVDKAVQGNVTILSPTKISEEEAYKVFESVLEVHGFTTVEAGSVIKILPSARARSQNVGMVNSAKTTSPEDRIVTQLVPLQYSSPTELKTVLTPLVSQTALIIPHIPSGMLIITETQSNIQKLLGIIEVLDVESREAEVVVLPLENASAPSLAKILTTIYQKRGSTQKAAGRISSGGDIKVVPYERVNAIIVLANASEMGRIQSLVALLDTKIQRAEGNIHVYYLQNATAVELAKVLNALPEKQKSDSVNKGKAAAISRSVRVMADEETNSLIITASKDEYAVLETVIEQLDIPRRMVYLEALIMEVDADKSFDVGVEWAVGGMSSDGTAQIGAGFSTGSYDYVTGINDSPPSLPSESFSVGVIKQGIKIGNVTFPNISAVLRAYKTDSEINIISTPQILTMDNKKAEISVGENVPYITSKNTTNSEQDYTNYEYKDVATKLSILPHINQADTLRLEIETEVVRLKGDSGVAENTPTTFKRTASTTVVLNDRDTVVIGGIIGHDATESEWKIPLLGDIPYLGWFFKTHSSTEIKTNMFIFVTPRIVRNPASLAAITMAKEENISDVLPTVKEQLHKKQNIEHAVVLTAKGYEKLQEGETAEAKTYLNEALAIDPKNPYALMNMGVVYEKENNPEAAVEMYQEVVTTSSAEVAGQASDSEKTGLPLIELATESIERVMSEKNRK